MRPVLGTIGICCLFPWQSYAANLTGSDLLIGCEAVIASESDRSNDVDIVQALKTGYCLGTLQGITTSVLAAQSDGFAPYICYPAAGVKTRELASITVSYLKRYPQLAGQDGALLATLALKEAYPCDSSKPEAKGNGR